MGLQETLGIIVALLTIPLLGYWALLIARILQGAEERRREQNQAMALKYSRIRKEEELKRLGLEDRAWS